MKCYKVHWAREAQPHEAYLHGDEHAPIPMMAEFHFVGSKRDVASFKKALRKMPHVDNDSIYDEQVVIPEKRKQTLDWLNNKLNFKYNTEKGTPNHGPIR